jgi:hypothetical protein
MCFLIGAGVGDIRDITAGNFAPVNAGLLLFTDLLPQPHFLCCCS